jgi:ADP-heptose:LPS heptosyltransferase
MKILPWYHLPQVELVRFKPIEFFPRLPTRIEDMKSICIGTKTRTIGDALMLSTLPRKLKQHYPHLKVLTYPRGFNPTVFWNNPYVDGITFIPNALYGDDCNAGGGHNIRLKENFFGVADDGIPRPELYLTAEEISWGEDFLKKNTRQDRHHLPLLAIHPFGHNFPKVLSPEVWEKLVARWKTHFRIFQVGVEGQTQILGCDFHFLAPRKRAFARKLFALMRKTGFFVGVDSGPMHIARAFQVPSLVITDGAPPSDIFKRRNSGPYYLYRNWNRAFLYEDLEHLYVPPLSAEELLEGMSQFLTNAAHKP